MEVWRLRARNFHRNFISYTLYDDLTMRVKSIYAQLEFPTAYNEISHHTNLTTFQSVYEFSFLIRQKLQKMEWPQKMLRKGPKNDLLQILIFHNPFIYTT